MKAPKNRKWLKPFLKPIRSVFREVLLMSFFINLLALAVPVFVLQVYDRVVFHAGISTLQGLVIGMAVVLVFEWVLRQSRSRIMQTVALRLDVEVGRKLFDKVTSLPLRDLEHRPAAYWQALFRDVDVVRNTLSGPSAVLLADLPFAILFLGLVVVIAPSLAWVLAVIVPLFMVVAWMSGHVMTEASRRERDSSMARDGLVAEMISGRTTIKALAMEDALRPGWEQRHATNIERSAFRGSRNDGFSNLGTSLTMVTTVAMTAVGAIAIINQELTIGALIAANMLSARMLGPLNQLVQQWRVFASYREAVDRLGEVFGLEEDRRDSVISSERPQGALTLEDVVFAYRPGDEPVVNGVRIKIPAGGVHALVGRNGSGKTTLLKLMQGLYRPDSGRILLDDADIGQFSRRELAHWVGYVPQECVLFSGTVRDNIAHRLPESSDEEIVKAAKESGAHAFIVDLPDGYGAEIGEAGRRLSGGQRQRLAIARALVGDPPVVLLDEPSSNLDRQAEADLRRVLAEIGRQRTVIVVTHSPILLTACDTLIALEKGRIALAGPAKKLIPRILGTAPKPVSAPAATPATTTTSTTTPVPAAAPAPAAGGEATPLPAGRPATREEAAGGGSA